MAYAVEMRILADGLELGADDVQIALDEGALKALLGQYNNLGIDFYKVAVVYPDRKEEHGQVRGRLTKGSQKRVIEEASRQPLTVAIVGEHDGETCCLYVRSNYPRRGREVMINLNLANKTDLAECQRHVTEHHYLHTPVDSRCSVEGYIVRCQMVPFPYDEFSGCLLFGRPEATRCGTWYGSVEDVQEGRCEVTRWSVLNLARVYLIPQVQRGGECCSRHYVPGFKDRRGHWRSTLASEAIKAAAQRIGYDYLLQRPPCFLEEPYQIRWLLSYCDTSLHRGTIYREAGWELYRTNERGLQTWRVALPPLTPEQDIEVRKRAGDSPRSRKHRARRAAQQTARQASLFEEGSVL